MKNKPNFNKPNTSNSNTENQAAQLAVIAGLITTLGDGLATVASIMALQEAQQSNQNSDNNQSNMELQKRMDALENELRQIKKMLRSNGK